MVFLGIVFKTRLKYSKELFTIMLKIQKLTLLIIRGFKRKYTLSFHLILGGSCEGQYSELKNADTDQLRCLGSLQPTPPLTKIFCPK